MLSLGGHTVFRAAGHVGLASLRFIYKYVAHPVAKELVFGRETGVCVNVQKLIEWELWLCIVHVASGVNSIRHDALR